MDWNLAIKKNREALAQIVAGLFLLVGWQKGEKRPEFLRGFTQRHLRTALRKAEAAVRRLIVLYVYVHGMKVVARKPRAKRERPLPDFSKFGLSSNDRPPVFNLFDPRKNISLILSLSKDEGEVYGASTISTLSSSGLSRGSNEYAEEIIQRLAQLSGKSFNNNTNEAWVDPRVDPRNKSEDKDDGGGMKLLPDPTKLLRRLVALDHALKTIPQQAKRLARIMAQREHAPPGPGKVPPMRPGAPPGSCKRSTEEIDLVLRECHGLVRDWESAPP